MHRLSSSTCLVLALLGLLGSAGCRGAKLPPTFKAGGTVLMNGVPVEGATVIFRAQDHPKLASGVTDAQGKFTLVTDGAGDGAFAGEHIVLVAKYEDDLAAKPDPNLPALPPGKKNVLPLKYNDANKSPLKQTVTKEGPNDFKIELK